MSRKEATLSLIATIVIILAASIVIALTGSGNFGTAQGQVNSTSELTPEQKAAICDPNNPSSKLDHVNTTESKICGLPVDPSGTANTTTAAEAPSDATGAEAPSAVPTPPEPEPEPEG
ncbi:MAG: hypothetical protein ACJ72F_01190 [Nitrososphaeraceae archaeon]|jgi:hypothetical protein